MSYTFTLRPCPFCGCPEFLQIPGAAISFHKHVQALMGLAGTQKMLPKPSFSLFICSMCGHTSLFSQNPQDMYQQVPGSAVVRCPD